MKKIKFYIVIIIIGILIPLIMQYLMNINITKSNIGSNDGWLGFWGGYLGSILSVGGVYGTFILQNKEDIKREVRNKRPFVNFTIHSSIKSKDVIYHSTKEINNSIFDSSLVKIDNPTDNLAMNILVAFYNEQNNLCDVVNVDYLKNESTLVYLRNFQKTKGIKIYISFLTEREEIGMTYQDYDNSNFSNFKNIYGNESKLKRNKIIKSFDDHNEKTKNADEYWFRHKTSMNIDFYNNLVRENVDKKMSMH